MGLLGRRQLQLETGILTLFLALNGLGMSSLWLNLLISNTEVILGTSSSQSWCNDQTRRTWKFASKLTTTRKKVFFQNKVAHSVSTLKLPGSILIWFAFQNQSSWFSWKVIVTASHLFMFNSTWQSNGCLAFCFKIVICQNRRILEKGIENVNLLN